jgi:hypothetical protein
VKGFRRRRGGRLQATLLPLEARMLATFAGQVIELLHEDTAPFGPGTAPADADPLEAMIELDGPVTAPEDPVLIRLLPDAYRQDEQASADFRRYTESGLRADKVANAHTVLATLIDGGFDPSAAGVADEAGSASVEIELDPQQVQAWLRCLTDMRLALATRLGIDGDDDVEEDLPDDDPRAVMYDVYGWLGYVQESLVQALG